MPEGNTALPNILLFGPHGAGISCALNAFQEHGYQVCRNIPIASLNVFLSPDITRERPVVLVPDLDPATLTPTQVVDTFQQLQEQAPGLKLFYLSSPTETLIQRFTHADKRHPFELEAGLRAAIESEQAIYRELKPLAEFHVDTSTTTPAELSMKVAKVLGKPMETQPLTLYLVSFGFKKGVPTDAELVFDMRLLPNPFYDESLRPLTGLDQPVSDYVFSFPEVREFLEHLSGLLGVSLPMYRQQGKTRLTIAIGCTGGQHRSVAMTMAVARYLQESFPDYRINVLHREQQNWPKQPTTLAT